MNYPTQGSFARTRRWRVYASLALALAAAVALVAGLPRMSNRKTYVFEFQMASDTAGVAQLFYDVAGQGFSESQSASVPIHASEEFRRYRLPLPSRPLYGLRFDPINTEARLKIRSAQIADSTGKTVRPIRPEEFEAVSDFGSVRVDHSVLAAVTLPRATDPSFLLSLPTNTTQSFSLAQWAADALPFGAATLGLLLLLPAALIRFATAVLAGFRSRVQHLGTPTAIVVLVFGIALLHAYPLSYFKGAASPAGSGGLFAFLNDGAPAIRAVFGVLATSIYALGCGIAAYCVARRQSIAALVTIASAASGVWMHQGILPTHLSLTYSPWVWLGWYWLADTRGTGARHSWRFAGLLLAANLQAIAAQPSLTGLLVLLTANVAGIGNTLAVFARGALRGTRAALAGVAAGLSALGCAWCVNAAPVSNASQSGLEWVPAAAAMLAIFEPRMVSSLAANPVFPSTNLLVLAGVAWAFARWDRFSRSAIFLSVLLATIPVAVLASGVVEHLYSQGLISRKPPVGLAHAASCALLFPATLIAAQGFRGFEGCVRRTDWGAYLAKASLLFFGPILIYLGSYQPHTTYSFPNVVLLLAATSWIVAHTTLAHLFRPTPPRSDIPQAKIPWVVLFVAAVALVLWINLPLLGATLRNFAAA